MIVHKRMRWIGAVVVLIAMLMPALAVSAQISDEPAFNRTWERTDQPVASGQVNRTWMWGPSPNSPLLLEYYADSPDSERLVQYFDKSRMEINNPDGDPNSIWYVTNGLLVVEMTSGEIQTGDHESIYWGPADVNVAGDSDDPLAPTYETISWNIEDGHTYSDGQPIGAVIDWFGYNPSLSDEWADYLMGYGVTAGPYSPETGKHTASVFWEFMTSEALVYESGGYFEDLLFVNPYYATGLPIDQAWWAEVKVAGTYKWVLIQCFERRCLTYTPDNPSGWQVEAGNVGQHYYTWRYGENQSLSEEEYLDLVWEIDEKFLYSLDTVEGLLRDPQIFDPVWVAAMSHELEYWQELAAEVFRIVPPPAFADIHPELVAGYMLLDDAVEKLMTGIQEFNGPLVQEGFNTYLDALNQIDKFFDLLEEH